MSIRIESPAPGRLRPRDLLGRWAESAGVDPAMLPTDGRLDDLFGRSARPFRPPVEPRRLSDWERRHGYRLPRGLRAWLALSDGFYLDLDSPAIHPVMGIGPMIPFARVPGMLVQPESWFELGNPGDTETLCIDLAYRWPGGDRPIFTSGDDLTGRPPRLIAPSFEAWFLHLLHEGGRPYWLDPGFPSLGDPWVEHRRRTPRPPLPSRLRRLLSRARPLVQLGRDERDIASALGISPFDVEALYRHLQHALPDGA